MGPTEALRCSLLAEVSLFKAKSFSPQISSRVAVIVVLPLRLKSSRLHRLNRRTSEHTAEESFPILVPPSGESRGHLQKTRCDSICTRRRIPN